MTRKLFALLISMSLLNPAPVFAQNKIEDIIYVLKVNPVSSAWDIRQEARKCMDNEACSKIVDAAAAYFGVPPGTIKETMDFADSIGVGASIKHNGEADKYTMDTVPNYWICNVGLKTISASPDRGKYSPTMDLFIKRNRIDVGTHVHKLKFGQGNSWIDAVVTIQMRHHTLHNATDCQVDEDKAKPIKYTCKGGRGNNSGLPACNNLQLKM